MDYSTVRGFNYQPSWGTCGLEIWRQFDADRFSHEVALGKLYFPKMNTLRIWLSHDAWLRDGNRFEAHFEAALAALARHGLVAIPVLFNRWHDGIQDYGGVYIDHFLPEYGQWLQSTGKLAAFTEAIMGPHINDPRVLAWDLCNEPFWGNPCQNAQDALYRAECAWLKEHYTLAKKLGVRAPITIGLTTATPLRDMEPLCDIFTFHPYWTGNGDAKTEAADFERLLDEHVAFARDVGKPIFITETCWGSLDDAKRVEIITYSMAQISKRGLGWLAYLLHHSLVIDCHRPEYGPVSNPGNLAFIEADGTLRPGHDVINRYMF